MIESRYKIEYVLPDEDVKKTSPFRVLWYLLLVPLVILLIIGITYDFSFNNLSRDTLVFAEKAKVHIFNLGEIQETKKKEQKEINKEIVNIVNTPAKSAPATLPKVAKEIAIETLISNTSTKLEPKTNQEKVKTSEFMSEQKLQLKAIQTQVTKNPEISQSLNLLSEKLVLEKLKTQQLNSNLKEQEKDRKELGEKLNQVLANSSNNQINLEELKTQNTQKAIPLSKPITIKNKDIIETEPKPIELTEEIPQEVVQEVIQEIAQEPIIKETLVEKSETDRIIETMENIASEKDKNVAAEKNITVDNEAITKLDSKTESDEVNIEKENISEKEIISKEQTSSKQVLIKNTIKSSSPTSTAQETEITIINKNADVALDLAVDVELAVDVDLEKNTEAKIEATNENQTKEQEQLKQIVEPNTQASGDNSAVDDIIAAMQESQSTSIETPDENTKIDNELQSEIKSN